MAMLTAFLFFIFGQYRTGATTGYSAVFADVSRLKAGDIGAGRRASGWARSTAFRCGRTRQWW